MITCLFLPTRKVSVGVERRFVDIWAFILLGLFTKTQHSIPISFSFNYKRQGNKIFEFKRGWESLAHSLLKLPG